MKALVKLAVLAAVVFLGLTIYKKIGQGQYGMSSEHLLGTFERLDALLVDDHSMAKAPASYVDGSRIDTTSHMTEYKHWRNNYERVVLIQNDAGDVVGVVGSWFRTEPVSHSNIYFFIRAYWKAAGGAANPQFTGAPMMGVTISRAEFQDGRLRGTWTRSTAEGSVETLYVRIE
jgi:hypothetical protein